MIMTTIFIVLEHVSGGDEGLPCIAFKTEEAANEFCFENPYGARRLSVFDCELVDKLGD